MHTRKRKNKTKKTISSELAKKIGQSLPYGSKDAIAEQVKCRKNYVRFILSGNGGNNLTTPMQLHIIAIASDMLKEKLAAIKNTLNEVISELTALEQLINEAA